MVRVGHPVDLHVFREVARAVNEHLRERALPVVLVPVGDAERVLRELRTPCDDRRHEPDQREADDGDEDVTGGDEYGQARTRGPIGNR